MFIGFGFNAKHFIILPGEYSYNKTVRYIIIYMKISKAYPFRFYPKVQQVEQLAKAFGCARLVWNQGLLRREYAFQQWGVSLSSTYDLSCQITGLKKLESHAWLKEATAGALQQKLIDQDKALDNFFKGRAKFKKKSHAQSVR